MDFAAFSCPALVIHTFVVMKNSSRAIPLFFHAAPTPASLSYACAVSRFISRENFNKYLNEKKFFFNGYYSDKKLDIDDKFIATVVDKEAAYDLGKQLKDILGHLMFILSGLAIIFFFTVMYMLTKIIIKRNSLHIAYLKIFGYTEIGRAHV